MKVLRSAIMKKLLARGIKRIAPFRNKLREGTLKPILTHELKNGWYYQVDLVYDKRLREKAFVVVYAFKPPRVYWIKGATHVLEEADA